MFLVEGEASVLCLAQAPGEAPPLPVCALVAFSVSGIWTSCHSQAHPRDSLGLLASLGGASRFPGSSVRDLCFGGQALREVELALGLLPLIPSEEAGDLSHWGGCGPRALCLGPQRFWRLEMPGVWKKESPGLQGHRLPRDDLGRVWFTPLEWHREAALGIWAPVWLSTPGLALSLSVQALRPALCPC